MKKPVVLKGKIDAVVWVQKNGYPEKGQFEEEKALQKFYKQLPTEILEDWCKLEGLTYNPCTTSEPIHRMRVCMAILEKHFPKDKAAKKESKYSKFTTEELVQLACDKMVPVEVCEDSRILRMRTIMALRAAKVIE